MKAEISRQLLVNLCRCTRCKIAENVKSRTCLLFLYHCY